MKRTRVTIEVLEDGTPESPLGTWTEIEKITTENAKSLAAALRARAEELDPTPALSKDDVEMAKNMFGLDLGKFTQ